MGFAHDEEVEMHYIETTNILEIEEMEQIPERSQRKRKYLSEILPQHAEVSEVTCGGIKSGEISSN